MRVPARWDLAGYMCRPRTTRIRLEDDFALRLQADWVRLRRLPDGAGVRRRFEKAAAGLTRQATAVTAVSNLPGHWTGLVYELPDRRRLLILFTLAAAARTFVFLQVHFGPEDEETPAALAQLLATSLVVYGDLPVPWEVYDVSIELPSGFRLVSSRLEAGRKMFLFSWRLRRLLLWQCALADRVLRERTAAAWAAELLNRCPELKGPRFGAAADGEVTIGRSRLYPFGHIEEIVRWCRGYTVQWRHDEAANTLYLWVFSWRRARDVDQLRGRFGPFPLAGNGAVSN